MKWLPGSTRRSRRTGADAQQFDEGDMMKKLNFCKLAGAVLAAALMSSTASAQTIRLTAASSHPPVLPWVGVLKDYVVPESNRRL